MESSKEQHLFDIEIPFNMFNVLSLFNKWIEKDVKQLTQTFEQKCVITKYY